MAIEVDLSILRDPAARRRLAWTTAVCLLAGLGHWLLAPRWYTSSVTVTPARPSRSAGLSSLLGGEFASLAAGLDGGSGATADPARIAAVLQSNAVSDAVITRFGLQARYRATYPEDAREDLWRHCAVKTLPKPGLVQVTCEDKDPAFARDLLGFLIEHGNQVFRQVSGSSAGEEARFLDQRVAVLKAQAEATSARMREFQETHGVVDLDSQAKAVVAALAGLNGQRLSKQIELDYARTYASGDEPSLRQLESQLSVVTHRYRDLERLEPSAAPGPVAAAAPAAPAAAPARASVFPRALEVPRMRAEYEALLRDRKVAEATLIVALERLENARANEARDVSTFLILDPASLPAKKSWPRGAISLGVAALLAVVAWLVVEWRAAGGWAHLRTGLAGGPGGRPAGSTDDAPRP